MSMEVALTGTLEKESDRAAFAQIIKDICNMMKVKMEDYDTTIIIDICPQGQIECSFEGRFISVVTQTNNAGPGFHAFVCTMYDEIVKMGRIAFEVHDSTGYFYERNFENLKYLHFYPWLKTLADYVEEKSVMDESICIAWSQQVYTPQSKAGCVVTPMGYIPVKDFKELDIDDLAFAFFIWNEKTRDANYYRNCALTLLWKDCFFEYSGMNAYTDHIAGMILDYLEAAYEFDHMIPLPMQDYRMLCTSIQRDANICHAQEMEIKTIGYRRNCIHYHFGNWLIPAHGYCEISYDKVTQTMHFMAPYMQDDDPWQWMIKANAFTHETEDATIIEGLLHPSDGVEYFTIQSKQLKGSGTIEKLPDYYTIKVEVICNRDTLYLECIIRHDNDVAKLKDWCCNVQYHPIIESLTIH